MENLTVDLTVEEKEILGDILSKLREIDDKTVVQNIKRHNFDIAVIAIAFNSKIDYIIKLENTNKRRYRLLNNEFKRLINKIF